MAQMADAFWLEMAIPVGLVGSAIVTAAYFASQQNWVSPQHWTFSLSNLIGASLILMSLYVRPNPAAAFIEIFWVGISAYGLFKSSEEEIKMESEPSPSENEVIKSPSISSIVGNAIELKDFAVRRGLSVPDAILKELSDIRAKVETNEPSKNIDSRLDAVLRDLTNITWPTTTRTLDFSAGRIKVGFFQHHFRAILFVLLGISLFMSIAGLVLAQCETAKYAEIGKHIFALSLGLLGSTTYIFLV